MQMWVWEALHGSLYLQVGYKGQTFGGEHCLSDLLIKVLQ